MEFMDLPFYNTKFIENLINNLKKVIISDNYIKIRNKPALSISKPDNFFNIRKVL